MIFFGRNSILESIKSAKYKVTQIYLQEQINVDGKIQEILQKAQESDINVSYTNNKQITKLTNSTDHQGVAANIEFKGNKLSTIIENSNNSNCYMYISDATYEHNVGAIIRTAEIAGINGVIIPNDLKITGVTGKTSAGALFHIDIYQDSIFNVIKYFSKKDYTIFGIERGGTVYFEEDLSQNCLLIIGSEDKGLSKSIIEKCNKLLEIPQRGNVNSLNMSVAASVVLFERLRQLSDV